MVWKSQESAVKSSPSPLPKDPKECMQHSLRSPLPIFKHKQRLIAVPLADSTITAQLEATHLDSIAFYSKSLRELSYCQKISYVISKILHSGCWNSWDVTQKEEFWKIVEAHKVSIPFPKPRNIGSDFKGRELGGVSPRDFFNNLNREREVEILRAESICFKQKKDKEQTDVEIEINRRKFLGVLQGRRMGIYEGDPAWDDVVPFSQEDVEGALAAIAYTDEYAEAMSYLRAIMAAKEHSRRALSLTAHIIALNPAHYTVWLYRASIIIGLDIPIATELEWLNEIAFNHQKNYQIWHHRQLLIDHFYPSIANDPIAKSNLASSEIKFIQVLLDEDSKNYHVWSYRQYLVRKLELFNQSELSFIEKILKNDIRNNSAWSHRFFIVFSNPDYSSATTHSMSCDARIPEDVIQREKAFVRASTFEAPQNPCPWNYLRGVLKESRQTVASEEEWASNFVNISETKDIDKISVRSSHALEFLADIWIEKGEFDKANTAFRLLSERFDRVRKNYWDWKRKYYMKQV